MEKQELINVFMEFIEDKFLELIEEKKRETGFSDGENYFFINDCGKASISVWEDDSVDEERLSIGNVFKTEEEAEFMVEKLKVLHELETLGRPFKSYEKNYYPIFNETENKIYFWWVSYSRELYSDCYFDSEEDAQQAIEKIGEVRIKKYLFGVGEE